MTVATCNAALPEVVIPTCNVQSEALMTLVPYKRIGETDDIGHAAVWLASDAADYVTGISLYIDGGMPLYSGFATGG